MVITAISTFWLKCFKVNGDIVLFHPQIFQRAALNDKDIFPYNHNTIILPNKTKERPILSNNRHIFPLVTSFNPRGEGPCPRSHGRKREKWNLYPGSLGRAVTTASVSQSRASPPTPRWRVLVKEVFEEGGWGWMTHASGADSLFRKPLGGAPRAT